MDIFKFVCENVDVRVKERLTCQGRSD